jgi:hypothetical protein
MEKAERILPKESTMGDRHTSRHNEIEFDVYKLIHATKEAPSTSVAVEDFLKDLRYPCWTDENEEKVTPEEVVDVYRSLGLEKAIETHSNLASHLKQIHHADYSHPIIIFESAVVDGMHRLAKARLEGQLSIKAKVLDAIPEETIIQRHPKDNEPG